MSTPVSTSGDAIATMVKNLKAMRSEWRAPIILAQVRELSRSEQLSVLEEIGRELYRDPTAEEGQKISDYFKREAEADREIVRRFRPSLGITSPVKSQWPFARGAFVVFLAAVFVWFVIPLSFLLWEKVGR